MVLINIVILLIIDASNKIKKQPPFNKSKIQRLKRQLITMIFTLVVTEIFQTQLYGVKLHKN